MSDHSAAIQHLEILQEQARHGALDSRRTLRDTAEYAKVSALHGLAHLIDRNEGAEAVYDAFLTTFRQTSDVEAAKQAAFVTVQTNVGEQTEVRRAGLLSAFEHINATFPKAS